VIPGTPETIFNSESTVAKEITKVVLHDGSYDNFIDHASCISLKLPLTVKVETKTFVLNTEADVIGLQGRIDDEDKIKIHFPAKVIDANYTETDVRDDKALKRLASDCGEDADNECVDFRFPLTLYTYNPDNQLKDTKTITADRTFYFLLKDLHKDELASIRYPIVVLPSGHDPIGVANNHELEDRIKAFSNTCDEGDSDESSTGDLENIIMMKEWKVTYFFDDFERTDDYKGYNFKFKPDHRLEAKDKMKVYGWWDIDDDELRIVFEGHFFSRLEHSWLITSHTDSKIRLTNDDSILIFEVK
jgi:hypothetical protein